jgi:hypothetical protein
MFNQYDNDTVETSVSFGFRGENLLLDEITTKLTVEPTSGFEKGDTFVGKKTKRTYVHPWGVWRYVSNLYSANVYEHIEFILNTFLPHRNAIRSITKNNQYFSLLSINKCSKSIFNELSITARTLHLCFDISDTVQIYLSISPFPSSNISSSLKISPFRKGIIFEIYNNKGIISMNSIYDMQNLLPTYLDNKIKNKSQYEFNSYNCVRSANYNDHLDCIVSILEHNKDNVIKFVNDKSYTVLLRFWETNQEGNLSIELDKNTMERLFFLCNSYSFSYMWYTCSEDLSASAK